MKRWVIGMIVLSGLAGSSALAHITLVYPRAAARNHFSDR